MLLSLKHFTYSHFKNVFFILYSNFISCLVFDLKSLQTGDVNLRDINLQKGEWLEQMALPKKKKFQKQSLDSGVYDRMHSFGPFLIFFRCLTTLQCSPTLTPGSAIHCALTSKTRQNLWCACSRYGCPISLQVSISFSYPCHLHENTSGFAYWQVRNMEQSLVTRLPKPTISQLQSCK